MSKELDPKQKYMDDKANLRVQKQEYEDDGNRYIFPAGETAPGAAIAPVTGQVPVAENINNQLAGNVQAAAVMPSASGETFVNPNASQAEAQRAPADVAAAPGAGVLTSPEVPIPDQSAQLNSAFSGLDKQTAAIDSQIDNLQKQKLADIDKKMAEDDANVPQIEPNGFFHGKSTWQKILGGVGMFLGAFTPEGARNVASIIEKEIDRDIDAQKTNIKLKQDKSDKTYQRLMERYGSQEAALLAKKRDAYGMLDLYIKKLELNARNAETRAKFQQGREEIGLKRQALGVEIVKAGMKQQQENMKYSVPGYNGAPLDPATKREFQNTLASADTINGSLNALSEVVKGTGESIPFTQANDRAKQYVNDIQLQLKEIKKLGVLSGADSERLDYYISNPSLFKSDARMQADIKGVKDLVGKAVASQERRLGLSKILPQGAQKKQ